MVRHLETLHHGRRPSTPRSMSHDRRDQDRQAGARTHCHCRSAGRDARPLRPFPDALAQSEGSLIGAINILIDITDGRQAAELRAQAERCRRLSWSTTDDQAGKALAQLAADYQAKAALLEKGFPAAKAS
jgi:hypothetical protein